MTKPMAFGEKEVGNQNAYFMWVMQRATYSVKGYGRINLSSSKGWERSFYGGGVSFYVGAPSEKEIMKVEGERTKEE